MADETQEKLEGFIVEMRGELRTIDVRLSRIEAVLPTFATKADLAMLESTLLKWFVGTALTATGIASSIAFAIAKLVY